MKTATKHIEFGDGERVLHFSGANGFAPATYQQFLGKLGTHFRVVAYNNRPLWSAENPWETLVDWQPFADDLIAFLDEQQLSDVIGMGHSLGSVVTMLAAVKRPDLFQSLVIIEPPLQMPDVFARWIQMREQIDLKTLPMVASALKRRNHWPDQETAYARYRAKRFFASWPDQTIRDYVTHGLIKNEDEDKNEDGWRLRFPPLWEGWIFASIPLNVWEQIANITIPMTVLRAEKTDVITAEAWQHWQAQQPDTRFIELPGVGHMLPFERPEWIADTVIKICDF